LRSHKENEGIINNNGVLLKNVKEINQTQKKSWGELIGFSTLMLCNCKLQKYCKTLAGESLNTYTGIHARTITVGVHRVIIGSR